MSIKKDGIMVILSSPSGAGKTTLVKLLSKNKNFNISTSHTTRKPRLNEIPDRDYCRPQCFQKITHVALTHNNNNNQFWFETTGYVMK